MKTGVILFVTVQTTRVINQALAKVMTGGKQLASTSCWNTWHPIGFQIIPFPRLGASPPPGRRGVGHDALAENVVLSVPTAGDKGGAAFPGATELRKSWSPPSSSSIHQRNPSIQKCVYK